MRIAWAPTRETSRLVEQPVNEFHPYSYVWVRPKFRGDVTAMGELVVTRPTLFR